MDERRHIGWRGAGLLIVLLASCALAIGAAILLRPNRFTSHQEEIAYVLQQHGIALTQVRLSQSSLDTQNFYAYAEYSIYGADVIINQALPDLASNDLTAWLDWLDRNLPRFALSRRASSGP